MEIKGRGAVAAVLAVALAVPLTGAAAADGLPPLRVGADGRSFTAGGDPFVWLGDSAWGLLTDLDRAGIEQYLDMRSAQGFTVVQTVVTADPNVYGDTPAAMAPGSDPADPAAYDYWDHVDHAVAAAAERGMRVALAPAWGGLAPSDARSFGEFLGTRYGGSVVWVLGSEDAGIGSPITWRQLAKGIALGSGVDNSELVMTYAPEPGKSSTELFGADEWLSFSLFRSGLCDDGVAPFTALLDDGRPFLDGQPTYEGAPDCAGPGRADALDVRRSAYADLFAGAAGHTYGNQAPTGDDGGADGMRHLRALLESRPFLGRLTAPDALTQGAAGVQALRAADGGHLMVYSPAGEPFALDTTVLPGESLRGWWFDPRTGTPIDAGTVARGRSVSFYPPTTGPQDAGLDWVLVVDDAARGFAPPGRAA